MNFLGHIVSRSLESAVSVLLGELRGRLGACCDSPEEKITDEFGLQSGRAAQETKGYYNAIIWKTEVGAGGWRACGWRACGWRA